MKGMVVGCVETGEAVWIVNGMIAGGASFEDAALKIETLANFDAYLSKLVTF